MLKSSAEFLLIYLIVSLYFPICLSPSALSCLVLELGAPQPLLEGAPSPRQSQPGPRLGLLPRWWCELFVNLSCDSVRLFGYG